MFMAFGKGVYTAETLIVGEILWRLASLPTVGEARAAANVWLIDHVPDRFTVGIPDYDPVQQGWRIPVWLAYPDLAPMGPVGELRVDAAIDAPFHTVDRCCEDFKRLDIFCQPRCDDPRTLPLHQASLPEQRYGVRR